MEELAKLEKFKKETIEKAKREAKEKEREEAKKKTAKEEAKEKERLRKEEDEKERVGRAEEDATRDKGKSDIPPPLRDSPHYRRSGPRSLPGRHQEPKRRTQYQCQRRQVQVILLCFYFI